MNRKVKKPLLNSYCGLEEISGSNKENWFCHLLDIKYTCIQQHIRITCLLSKTWIAIWVLYTPALKILINVKFNQRWSTFYQEWWRFPIDIFHQIPFYYERKLVLPFYAHNKIFLVLMIFSNSFPLCVRGIFCIDLWIQIPKASIRFSRSKGQVLDRGPSEWKIPFPLKCFWPVQFPIKLLHNPNSDL